MNRFPSANTADKIAPVSLTEALISSARWSRQGPSAGRSGADGKPDADDRKGARERDHRRSHAHLLPKIFAHVSIGDRKADSLRFNRSYGFQAVRLDRQLAQPHARRRIDSVEHGGRQRRRAGLADAAGLLAALDDLDLDRRSLVDAQHAVVVEVRLLDAAVLERDLAPQRRGDAEDDAALHLRHDGIGIDGDAGVDDADDAVDVHLADVGDRDLGDLRHVASERVVHAYAAAASVAQRLAPAGNFRRAVQDVQRARIIAEHRAAVLDGVLFRDRRQLVDEALDDVDVVRGADAAPERGRNARRLLAHVFDALVGNGVGHVDRAIDRVGIDAVLEQRAGRTAP